MRELLTVAIVGGVGAAVTVGLAVLMARRQERRMKAQGYRLCECGGKWLKMAPPSETATFLLDQIKAHPENWDNTAKVLARLVETWKCAAHAWKHEEDGTEHCGDCDGYGLCDICHHKYEYEGMARLALEKRDTAMKMAEDYRKQVRNLEMQRNQVPVLDGCGGWRFEQVGEAQQILAGEGTHLGVRRDLLEAIVRMAHSAWGSYERARQLEQRLKELGADENRS